MDCADTDEPAGEGGAAKAAIRSPRHRAREFALQGLYGWLLAGGECGEITRRFQSSPGYAEVDEAYFIELMQGVTASAAALRAQFTDAIDRPLAQLSPIEHTILLIATYELAHRPEIPYRVVIDEAVELAKDFGGSEGHRYVNAVLDKVAARMRGADGGAGT